VEKIKIGISTCLLGQKVRYDGGHKLDRYIVETLGRYFDYVPVCPEVDYGLPVPREPLRLMGDSASPRLMTVRTGIDHTEGMEGWAKKEVDDLARQGLCGFIFKSRSPSSGLKGVKVYTPSGSVSKGGVGIFAAAFTRRYPLTPVIDDGRLHDPGLRETFVDSVFVYRRWQEFLEKGGRPKNLVAFHTDMKFLIMAHSPGHYRMLGQMAAKAGSLKTDELHASYGALLMEGLGLRATISKHTNVLLHGMGYFKKVLTRDEKEELLHVIETYHKGYVPLIVPVTLINHYVRKYREPYLERQIYFNPYPEELMLRNHV
jgi:uncharacterized protein YbgA (DUF1722 family)/uncharacterized protein YbbK (DUF523 family)